MARVAGPRATRKAVVAGTWPVKLYASVHKLKILLRQNGIFVVQLRVLLQLVVRLGPLVPMLALTSAAAPVLAPRVVVIVVRTVRRGKWPG